jgi:hypothetical protein
MNQQQLWDRQNELADVVRFKRRVMELNTTLREAEARELEARQAHGEARAATRQARAKLDDFIAGDLRPLGPLFDQPNGHKDQTPIQRCRECGCTDDDCRQCVEKTGMPCHWVEPDLCSACVEEKAPAIREELGGKPPSHPPQKPSGRGRGTGKMFRQTASPAKEEAPPKPKPRGKKEKA